MTFHSNGLFTEGKNIPDDKHKDCERVENGLFRATSAKMMQNSITINQMQRRLFLLLNASTKNNQDSQPLNQKQKASVELWTHIKNCKQKDCKRRYCLRSRHIIDHFYRCRMLKRCFTCKLCAPVINQILMNRKHDTSQKQTQHPQESRTLQTKTAPFRSNDLSDRCHVSWHNSVKGGHEEDSLFQTIRKYNGKKRPLPSSFRHGNKKNYKKITTRNASNPTLTLSKKKMLPSERVNIVCASIVLMRMKKKTRDEMIPKHNTRSISTSISGEDSGENSFPSPGQNCSKKRRIEQRLCAHTLIEMSLERSL